MWWRSIGYAWPPLVGRRWPRVRVTGGLHRSRSIKAGSASSRRAEGSSLSLLVKRSWCLKFKKTKAPSEKAEQTKNKTRNTDAFCLQVKGVVRRWAVVSQPFRGQNGHCRLDMLIGLLYFRNCLLFSVTLGIQVRDRHSKVQDRGNLNWEAERFILPQNASRTFGRCYCFSLTGRWGGWWAPETGLIFVFLKCNIIFHI